MPDGSLRTVPGGSTIKAPLPTPPVRQYSFTLNSINNPTSQQPGDRMDAEYDRSNQSLSQLITFCSVTFNTDGSLKPGSVGTPQLDPAIVDDITQEVEAQVQPLVTQAQNSASAAWGSANNAQTSATFASTYANSAGQAASAAAVSQTTASGAAVSASASAGTATTAASNASNAANHTAGDVALSSDYALVCQAWAEHMPDTIPPNILAVMGITGDHWSSRWWANEAANTVSNATNDLDEALNDALDQINQAGEYWLGVLQDQTQSALEGIQSFYLGAFPIPPVADSFGNAIATGAIYYDLSLSAAYVWNGTHWVPLSKPAPTQITRYIYVATAGQTVFQGPDRNGNALAYNPANYQTIEVFKQGLLLTPTNDYTEAVNQVTLTVGAAAGNIIQLLVAGVPVVNLQWNTVRIDTTAWTPTGGTLKDYQANLLHPNAASDVLVSVDGVWQQADIDYTVAGNLLSFTTNLLPSFTTFGLAIVPSQPGGPPIPGLTKLDTSAWVFDGTQTTFPLKDMGGTPVSPHSSANTLVSLNGVWEEAERDYTVAGSTITFTTPPEPNAHVFALAGLPALN